MKKVISFICVVIILISLCAFSNDNIPDSPTTDVLITAPTEVHTTPTESPPEIPTNAPTEAPTSCDHTYNNPTCTTAKICSKCGITEGTALGHTWKEATCSAPKTCSTCGTTEGNTIGHKYTNGICTMCNYAPDVSITRIWMDEPGRTLQVGDSVTFFIEASFKYNPGNFVLWFTSL